MSKLSIALFVILAIFAIVQVSADVIKIRQLPRSIDMFGNSFQKRIGDGIIINSFMSAQFYGPATIGGQEFNFIWDTGSSNVWVIDAYAKDTYKHPAYNQTLSPTYEEVIPPRDFIINYVSGAVMGHVVRDDVTAGTATAKNMELAAITDVTPLGMAFAIGKFDGIIGLGFRSISIDNMETYMENVVRTQGLPGVFAFQLPVNDEEPGSLQIGGYDESKYYGELNYIPIAEKNYWLFRSQGVSLGGTSVSAKVFVLDSGTSLIAGPSEDVAKLASSVGATQSPFNKSQYFIACDSKLPVLEFKVNRDISLVLQPKDYVINGGEGLCIFGLMGVDMKAPDPDDNTKPAPIWILGDSVMKKYYSVFDMDKNAIGIAVSKMYRD